MDNISYIRDMGKRGGVNRVINSIKRSLRLYQSYWISVVIFVLFIGIMVQQEYPFEPIEFIENATGWKSTYNFSTWFLLHYVLLILASPILFRLLDNTSTVWFTSIVLIVYLSACLLQSRYNSTYLLEHYTAYQMVKFVSCIFPFSAGAVFAYYAGRKVEYHWCKNWMLILLTIVVFIARCYIPRPVTFPFTAIILVFLFAQVKLNKNIKCILEICGVYSLEIWLVHSYFNQYLFAEYIYAFKLPLFILIAIIGLCIIYGMMARKIINKLYE